MRLDGLPLEDADPEPRVSFRWLCKNGALEELKKILDSLLDELNDSRFWLQLHGD
jgi:hypothetical protein